MKADFKVGLKHWTGTAIVAVLAGFVIFGLLRGQEILNDFLKSEPTDANLEKGKLLVLIPSPAPKQLPLLPTLTSTPASSLTSKKTPVPTKTVTPAPTLISTPLPSASSIPAPTRNSTPLPTSSPTPPPTPIPTLMPSPTPTPLQTPLPTPTPSPTPSPIPLVGPVIINEIAWMGTAANASDEWIELYNSNSQDADISNWTLQSTTDGKPAIVFPQNTIIPAFSYFLIERTDDNTVKDIPADLKIGFGSGAGSGLSNLGEIMHLYDGQSNLKDKVGHKDETGQVVSWYSGQNTTKSTMERVNPANSGNEPSNWQTNNGITKNGLDAEGNLINGTPRAKNSN